MWSLYINLMSKYILENHIKLLIHHFNQHVYLTGSGVASIPNILAGVATGVASNPVVTPMIIYHQGRKMRLGE